MSEKIIYDYDKMNDAVTKINDLSDVYKKAGEDFISGFVSATNNWEGESKDKMLKLITKDVNDLLTNAIPSYLKSLSLLLSENVKQMQKADNQIADSIPDQLS